MDSPLDLSPIALERRIRELCALGPRFAGTAGERSARALIAGALRDAGASEVQEEPVLVLGYTPKLASLVVHSSGRELPAVGLQFSASGSATGRGVYLGEVQSEDDVRLLEDRGAHLQDTIVVFHSIYPYLLMPHLIRRGVAGAVVISDAPSGVIGHYTAQLYPP